MYHYAWPEVVWLPDLTWRQRKWRHKTESGWFPCTISFIWLLRYLVEIPQWERRRDKKTPLEYYTTPRTNQNTPQRESSTFGLMTSLPLTNLLFFSFFFHSTCLTSNNTNLCTISVASMVFSNSLVTSVMLNTPQRESSTFGLMTSLPLTSRQIRYPYYFRSCAMIHFILIL
jgi:hypothetical protein